MESKQKKKRFIAKQQKNNCAILTTSYCRLFYAIGEQEKPRKLPMGILKVTSGHLLEKREKSWRI
jgi:hypothetical protein